MFLITSETSIINLDNVCEIWLRNMFIFARMTDGSRVQLSSTSTINDLERLAEKLDARRI